MRTSTRWSVALTLCTLAGGAAAQATLRVPSVYSTIQDAIDAAQDGDTIEISKGTYTENLVVDGFSELRLVGKGKVVVRGGSGSPVLSVVDSWLWAQRIVFEGLGRDAAEVQAGLSFTGNGPADALLLWKVRVSDVSGAGVLALGDGWLFVEKSIVEECGGTGVLAQGLRSVAVRSSTIQDCDGDGVVATDGEDMTLGRGDHDPASGRLKVRRVGGDAVIASAPGNLFNNTSWFRSILVKDCGGGISVDGEIFVVEGCKVTDVDGTGLAVASTETFDDFSNPVTKNWVTRAAGVGLWLSGSAMLVEGNTIKNSGATGLRVGGVGGHTVQGNTIVSPIGHGITLGTETSGPDEVRLLANVVKKAGGDGIVVGTSANDVHENSIKKSGSVGLRLVDGGNDVRANTVKASGEHDLSDTAPSDTNVYDGNTFGTVDPLGHQP